MTYTVWDDDYGDRWVNWAAFIEFYRATRERNDATAEDNEGEI